MQSRTLLTLPNLTSVNYTRSDVSGNSVIGICNPADLAEIWSDIRKGKKVVLWCGGLKAKSNSKSESSKQIRESDGEHLEAPTSSMFV